MNNAEDYFQFLFVIIFLFLQESVIQKMETELVKLHIISALRAWQHIPMATKPTDTGTSRTHLLSDYSVSSIVG